jgi:mevalonate kinase
MLQNFNSNGKLLLTGEYVVLDGAKALAVPTKQGQSLHVATTNTKQIEWLSFDVQKNIWFQDSFALDEVFKTTLSNLIVRTPTTRLQQVLIAARQLNPNFLLHSNGVNVETYLDFPQHWGLGTSSTLINNVAQWAKVNPYNLLQLTFGGSGYDIACAQHNTPIAYTLRDDKPLVAPVAFSPSFASHLYFVYLNKKQNSRDGIAHYKALRKTNLSTDLSKIDAITEAMLSCNSLSSFTTLMDTHESIIARLTQQDTVKSLFFKDFNGAIKSLGAWGGDFILAATSTNPTSYFNAKGFDTVIPYNDMVL